jgi:PAS domain S-box-containing protein
VREDTRSTNGDGGDQLFAGPGEMRERCRAFGWAATPLGPPDAWSRSLRTAVGIVLGSRNPMFLWWGPELVQLYNDAYRPSLGQGGRHPRALGCRGREFWTDIWETIGPQIEQVMTTGEATWHEDQYLPIERNGRLEDVWWTYGYSPVHDDDGRIAGTLVVCQETTLRVMAERERERLLEDTRRAERRLVRVLDQVSDEHLTMDADFRILTVNRAAERNLGVARETLVGLTHWEAFPASVGSPLEGMYRRVMEERAEAHFTNHYVGEGYDRHLEIDAYPTDDGGIALFWRDVSERVRAERALRESEVRLRAIYDGTYEYIGLISPGGTVLECNRASLEFAGNAREDVVGLPFWETPWFVHTPGAAEGLREWVACAAGGEFVRREVVLHRPSGEPIAFDFSLHPIRDAAGEVIYIVPEGRDVTERVRLLGALEVERARLAQVFQRAPSFIVAFRGADQVYEFVNEAYYQLVGHRDILGKPLLEAIPEIRGQGFVELLERVRQTGEPWVGRETPVELQRTPGAPIETRYLDMVFQALAEPDGSRTGVVAHGSDVTEQVLARREVERLLAESERARAEAEAARADAEQANRAKGEFLAVMSHELRTPLNAIGGYAELMELGLRGPVTEEQRADLARIQQSQRHLLGLINQVLNYTRVETGTVRYDMADVVVGEALAAAEALIVPQVRARGLTYVLGGCDPALRVRADREKLQQILLNLLTNAIKFTDPGGELRVACDARPDVVAISVADTGVGIAADKLASVFEPFVQVDQRLTRPHEGVGLGLAISRDLARGMGGDLVAESTPGAGSTFTLTLPASGGESFQIA